MNFNQYETTTRIGHKINYDDTRVGFVYVPKTGGTYLSILPVPKKFKLKPSGLPKDLHMPVSKIRSITQDTIPLFTVLRDPYDRVCSEYYFTINRVKAISLLEKWEDSDSNKIEFLARRAVTIMDHKEHYQKILNIYKYKMSIEDYLDWSADNPTYSHYYDEKTPKDFDIVGLTEEIEKTRQLLKIIYQTSSGNGTYNNNSDKVLKKPYETSYPRSKFKSKNFIEYDFYEQGKEKFDSLAKKYL